MEFCAAVPCVAVPEFASGATEGGAVEVPTAPAVGELDSACVCVEEPFNSGLRFAGICVVPNDTELAGTVPLGLIPVLLLIPLVPIPVLLIPVLMSVPPRGSVLPLVFSAKLGAATVFSFRKRIQ